MITEQDLKSAIAECQGERDPNANTCVKLAAYYTIYKEMYGKAEQPINARQPEQERPTYSFSATPDDAVTITLRGGEIAKAAKGKNPERVGEILTEMMAALEVLNPRLYAGVLRKIRE